MSSPRASTSTDRETSARDEPSSWAAALVEPFAPLPGVVAAVVDGNGVVLALSRALGRVEPGAARGRALRELVLPAHADALTAAVTAAHAESRASQLELVAPGDDGALGWYQVSVAPATLRHEDHGGVLVVATDVTERHETEARLRRAEALMVDTQGVAHLGTWEWDVSQPTAVWSDELYRIYGLSPETYAPSYEAYLGMVHPDDRAHVMAATERVFREHVPYSHDERVYRPDGSMRYLHTWAHAILDAQGRLTRLVGVCQDITDRKLAELALEQRARELAEVIARLEREMLERAEVEKQLRQAHKLEALGRLAGGIAHDFNNLLGVVTGYASMLGERMPEGDPLRRYAAEILKAGDRAARMTQQLLAFSRDQLVAPRRLDLCELVRDLSAMLGKLIGEDIELRTLLAPAPCWVEADHGQLEQVLVNLVVNARDAMPQGGTLTIATALLAPGEAGGVEAHALIGAHSTPPTGVVQLSVIDTGVGMDDAVQARIFDPFFTTKPEGKGTGLGLATVFGVVRQSGGSIRVRSAPGAGARFDVCLPAASQDEAPKRDDARAEAPARGTETVLLVEDESALRSVVCEALEAHGYTVLQAADGAEALRRASEHQGAIDLLLTDVVLPRHSGRELAERLTAQRPTLRVLYMSGYTDDVVLQRGVREHVVRFMRKPFTPRELHAQVRTALDAPAPGRAS